MHCEYPTQIRYVSARGTTLQASPAVSDQHNAVGRSPHSASPTFTDANRPQLELGLFQYYSYTVARTFPFSNTERGLMLHSDVVPQASLQCSNLLNVIYAYALLHMHIQSVWYGKLPRNAVYFEDLGVRMSHISSPVDDGRVDLLTLHRDYLNAALQGQRNVVSAINHKNADGICIAAMLLAQVALVHSAQDSYDEFYAIPTDWFRLQVSFGACLKQSRSLLNMESATSMLINSLPSIDNMNLDRHELSTFKDLLDWRPEGSTERMDNRTRETYRTCVAYIETIYQRIASKEVWHALGRRILAFPNVGDAALLSLLDDHQPRALVILAHLLAMMKRMEIGWWIFKDVADYHVRGIGAMIPAEWQWAMEWPLKVLETGGADECFVVELQPPPNEGDIPLREIHLADYLGRMMSANGR